MSAQLQIDNDLLQPLIIETVKQAVAQLDELRMRFDDRLAYTEAEAARLIGLNARQLAGERRRGRISASAIVGRRIRYQRCDILEYLNSRPWTAKNGMTA